MSLGSLLSQDTQALLLPLSCVTTGIGLHSLGLIFFLYLEGPTAAT